MSGVRPAESGAASGVLPAQQIGGGLGRAVLVAVSGAVGRPATGGAAQVLAHGGAAAFAAAVFSVAAAVAAATLRRAD